MPYFKKAIRMVFAFGFWIRRFPRGFSDLLDLDSLVLSPVFVKRSSSHSKVSALKIVLEKSSTAVLVFLASFWTKSLVCVKML
jgi:hypothetical protein